MAGFVVLSLEILGFRLFAPYFGFSVYVSGSLITMVLVALSGGYYLGGKLADRHPELQFLYNWIMIAAAYLVLITLTYKKILAYFAPYSPVFGTVISTIIIFAFPMIVLSMVSPFLVKVLIKKSNTQKVGEIVGNISAVSTIGSIVGTVVTTFIFVPELGSKATLIICDLSLFTISIIYLLSRETRYLFAFILPILLLFSHFAGSRSEANLIFEKESVYNLVRVIKEEDSYILQLNDKKNLQSLFTSDYSSKKIFTGHYFDLLNVAPVIANGRDILILGLGGGTSANQLSTIFPSSIEAVEIDPVVVEVAEKYFSIKKVNPDLKVHVIDARTYLHKTNRKYDVIEVDMFHGGFYIPFYVSTKEFFEQVKDHLNDNGVMIMNVLTSDTEKGDELYHYIGNTMRRVFDQVFAIKAVKSKSNAIMIATKEEMSLLELQKRIRQSPFIENEAMKLILNYAIDNVIIYDYNPAYGIFTDDRAPIERVTYSILKKR